MQTENIWGKPVSNGFTTCREQFTAVDSPEAMQTAAGTVDHPLTCCEQVFPNSSPKYNSDKFLRRFYKLGKRFVRALALLHPGQSAQDCFVISSPQGMPDRFEWKVQNFAQKVHRRLAGFVDLFGSRFPAELFHWNAKFFGNRLKNPFGVRFGDPGWCPV